MENPMRILVLASASPRRKFLLSEAGLKFKIVVPAIDETQQPKESPEKYVKRLSREKAMNVAMRLKHPSIVLAADTTVVEKNGHILNKPKNIPDAERMIRRLQGRSHRVFTGVTLLEIKKNKILKIKSFVIKTEVFFRSLSKKQCVDYAKTREGLDKAGAYAAQGRGMAIVSRIRGSYTNVVGLPLSEVLEVLEQDFSYGN